MEIPVYLIVGFLESGKTHFIRETLQDPAFTEDEKTLLLVCEEGEEEYDEGFCRRTHAVVQPVDGFEQFTSANLKAWDKQFKPDRVIIEYNGMWKLGDLQAVTLPRGWVCYQTIAVCDSTTFKTYQANMRALMSDKFTMAEMVLFNRCTPDLDKQLMARSVRLVNRRSQLGFELPDGTEDTTFVEELPYDLNAPVIDIADEDYGVWYTDAMDAPEKYAGKTVRFTAQVCIDPKFPKGCFAPGRHAMVCCQNDITFLGYVCKAGKLPMPAHESFIRLTALVKSEFYPEYGGKGPVLYAQSIEPCQPPRDKLVYF
mgnify:CR=1 FL=1